MKNVYLCLFASFVCGCSATAALTTNEATVQFLTDDIIVPDHLQGAVSIVCVKDGAKRKIKDRAKRKIKDRVSDSDKRKTTKERECLYLSIDGNKLYSQADTYMQSTAESSKLRKDVMEIAVNLSDMNCSTYLHRVLANKSGFDVFSDIGESFMTAISAGTAITSPGVARGLSLSNLVLGTTVDQFNNTYFMNETFQALESISQAERLKIKLFIQAKQLLADESEVDDINYGLFEGLSDVRELDDACSMRVALAKLAEIADDERKTEEEFVKKLSYKSSAEKLAEIEGHLTNQRG
jgi:hypothetical protein